MTCEKAEKYLTPLVDGELKNWWLRWKLHQHLKKCAVCQKMLEIQKQIKYMIRTRVTRVRAPEKFKAELSLRLMQEFGDENLHPAS